ncbi:hypothetical protein ACFFU1_16775 [Algibacter miyuki]|uniref:Uncharacterized protein n=1 Tax=Algibacter miyuki TaxID=1306933 RepID=A0ABV5H5H6_9FLAO|nr:hypothetical protein [Algibacter miyuki]MDN3665634.1 hypothetical protein [Algibacter miyuki]
MTETEIIELFKIEIEKPDFKAKAGVNKQQHYNYRNRTTKVGLMIEILFKVGAITITKT